MNQSQTNLSTSLISEKVQHLDLDLNSAAEETLAEALGTDRARVLVQSRPFDYWSELRRMPGFTASFIADLRESGARLEPVSE